MENKIENYITEEEKKEIALSMFKDKIQEAFGGDEYTPSGKEADRVMKNAVALWITEYIEKILTDKQKNTIRKNVENTIKEKTDLSYYIFQKPDVWDRSEYTAYSIINKAIKENEEFIKKSVSKEILKKFTLED